MKIQRKNRKTQRNTGSIPSEVWDEQLLKRTARLIPTPAPTLLDLHCSLRTTRKVHIGPSIEFHGQDYEIAPTSRTGSPPCFFTHFPSSGFSIIHQS
jgi:hypothetical protein